MESGNAVFHMTTDERSQAQLKTGPVSTTTFHSDLPYVLVKEQFELTSYTQWSGSDGGRKFAFSQDLIDYRDDNPDLAYLLVLEDSSGNSWVHDPLINARLSWYNLYNGLNTIALAINGADYQVAYTDSDGQLEDLTKNTWTLSSYALTFRTWDTNDTSVTVFKTPVDKDCREESMFIDPSSTNSYNKSLMRWMTDAQTSGGTDLKSSGLDVTKVRFVFLNIKHTSSAFELQKGFSKNEISIKPSEFKVHNIDLGGTTPLVSHGNVSSGATITPVISGTLASGKVTGTTLTSAKVNSSNQLLNGDAPVIEIPTDAGTFTGWDFDFNTRTIKRNNIDVYSDTIAANAIGVIGSQVIDVSPSLTLTSSSVTQTLTSTATGSLGNVDGDTIFLASVVSGSSKLHSSSLMGVGDNLIADFIVGGYQHVASLGQYRWSNNIKIYLNISANGATVVKVFWEPGNDSNYPNPIYRNSWYNISQVSLVIPDLKVRLIALGNLGQ
jgi:hypothetical protein